MPCFIHGQFSYSFLFYDSFHFFQFLSLSRLFILWAIPLHINIRLVAFDGIDEIDEIDEIFEIDTAEDSELENRIYSTLHKFHENSEFNFDIFNNFNCQLNCTNSY